MARTPTREEAEATLRALVAGTHRGREGVAKALRPDVDPQLAADAARSIMRNPWLFARSSQRLSAAAIRALLATPRTPDLDGRIDATLVFLKEATRAAEREDDALTTAWAEALQALLDANTSYGWGSKQRRAKIRGLAESRFLPAIQAVASGCAQVPLDLLAVLAADGSEASADALLPHFHRAATDETRKLDLLDNLRTHAADTPAIRAMLAEVERLLGARQAASPALEVARALGFGALDSFWFWAFLGSNQRNRNRVPSVQSNLRIDSRAESWFSVSISVVDPVQLDAGSTSFTDSTIFRDDLGLGRCDAVALPALLARAAKLLSITWDFAALSPSTNLRGKKRAALVAWLRGGG